MTQSTISRTFYVSDRQEVHSEHRSKHKTNEIGLSYTFFYTLKA